MLVLNKSRNSTIRTGMKSTGKQLKRRAAVKLRLHDKNVHATYVFAMNKSRNCKL